MSIIRIRKSRPAPYVVLDTTALNDPRLSFRAKGLHTYLMSKPDDWQVHLGHLAKQSPTEGREALRTAMHELIAAGYAKRPMVRDAQGRFHGKPTIIYETPQLADEDTTDDEPHEASDEVRPADETTSAHDHAAPPTSVTPKSGNPTSDLPTLLINDCTYDGSELNIEKNVQDLGHADAARPTPCRERFEQFWDKYPKKKAKGAAWRVWGKLRPSAVLLDTMLEALQHQRSSLDWLRDQGQFIPHPATWLHQERWMDELTIAGTMTLEEMQAKVDREEEEWEAWKRQHSQD